ncbi:MAG: hypothetical protein WBA62_21995 [Xanthobacteraceae bacterium]
MAKSQVSLEQAMASLARVSEQNARQYQQMVQMQRTAADAQMRAMNDNSRSISENGIEWAEWSNRAKRAGEVALLLSPKLRAVVLAQRELAATFAQKAIVPALELTAMGIVKSTNLAGTGLIALAGAAEKASPSLLGLTSHVRSAGIALEAFSPTIAGVAGTILGKIVPVLATVMRFVTPILLVKNAFDLLSEAWTLGGKKLEEYRGIAEKAAAVDLSISYFQRITKAATDAKLPVDVLAKALQNLQSVSTDQLGGSVLNNRLSEHLKAGNFAGNSGVTALGQANTTEDRFKAIIKLIDEANAKGERLAALDIAKTAFGDDIAGRLRQDSEYLHNIEASAEKISATQLVSDADVGRALDLQRRYDAAIAILEQRWHPIQDLLTQLGIKMQAAWVGIVEAIANAVDGAAKLVMKIGEIPASFWAYLAKGASVVVPAVGAAAGAVFGPVGAVAGYAAGKASTSGGDDAGPLDARATAVNRLAAGLKNHNSVVAAGTVALGVYDNVIRDTSKTLDDNKKKHEEAADAVDRAINSVSRHVEQQKAEAAAVGLGAAALAAFRVQAAETAAVQANGGKETAEQASRFAQLKVEAGAAADALARAKVNNAISRGSQTALLSPEDVQIANQLKDIYPDVATALGSVEASALRTNDALRQYSDVSRDASKGFIHDILSGTSALQSLGSALQKVGDKLIDMAVNGLWSKAFGGTGGSGILGLLGIGGGPITLGGPAGPVPFADGGYTGAGSKYQVAGVVHAGEYVFNQNAVNRIGLGNLDRLHRGYADGGPVMPPIVQFRAPANDNAGIVVHGGDTYLTVQGNTDDRSLVEIKRELAKRDAELDSRVENAVRKAQQGRRL